MTFTWRNLDNDTLQPIEGAAVVMKRISDGAQFTAVSGVDGYAYVNGPVLPYDQFYNSTVTKQGYQTYSLTNTNWGDGGQWIARMAPTGSQQCPVGSHWDSDRGRCVPNIVPDIKTLLASAIAPIALGTAIVKVMGK